MTPCRYSLLCYWIMPKRREKWWKSSHSAWEARSACLRTFSRIQDFNNTNYAHWAKNSLVSQRTVWRSTLWTIGLNSPSTRSIYSYSLEGILIVIGPIDRTVQKYASWSQQEPRSKMYHYLQLVRYPAKPSMCDARYVLPSHGERRNTTATDCRQWPCNWNKKAQTWHMKLSPQ